MKLQLNPLDPLFFRDGRPFSMGEESNAEGVFPPLPSTVRGSLRSHWISNQLDNDKVDFDMLAKKSNILKLAYFGLGVDDKPVFPAPLDFHLPDNTSEQKPDANGSSFARAMSLISKSDFSSSSCPTEVSHLFRTAFNGKTKPVTGYLLNHKEMVKYLSGGQSKDFALLQIGDYLEKEHKIGIGRDNNLHRAKDGLLFRFIANRFQDDFGEQKALSLLVDVEGWDTIVSQLTELAVMPMGGERRSVTAKVSDFSLPEKPVIKGKLFKIVLVTHAPLNNWYPEHLLETYTDLKLVAASIGKPISVGGWDIATQKPKPMRRAIPAGSVYLLEASDESQANEICSEYHGASLCQFPFDREGFGICFITQPFDNQNK